MSVTGGRSKETPRYLRGMTALSRRERRRSTRAGRQRHGVATRVASSIDEAAAVALAEGARRLVDHAARWSPRKRGYSFWKVRGTSPSPPLRCLAMMSSASPGLSVVSGK